MRQQQKLARRIKSRRLQLEWTQDELASRMGMHQPDISLLESGESDPKLSTLQKLSLVLGLKINDLVDEIE